MTASTEAQIRQVYEQWHHAINHGDLAGMMALYAEHAVMETPAILAMFKEKDEGILRGKAEIEQLFAINFRVLADSFRELYRSGIFLANGDLLLWEYPRKTPGGAQVDLVESMDIENGLIVYHRVYWGWKGFKVLQAASAGWP
jgi:steroid delta-isomerase